MKTQGLSQQVWARLQRASSGAPGPARAGTEALGSLLPGHTRGTGSGSPTCWLAEDWRMRPCPRSLKRQALPRSAWRCLSAENMLLPLGQLVPWVLWGPRHPAAASVGLYCPHPEQLALAVPPGRARGALPCSCVCEQDGAQDGAEQRTPGGDRPSSLPCGLEVGEWCGQGQPGTRSLCDVGSVHCHRCDGELSAPVIFAGDVFPVKHNITMVSSLIIWPHLRLRPTQLSWVSHAPQPLCDVCAIGHGW